jgi:ribosomal protein L40E
MTINTWRSEILKICRTCHQFSDIGKSRCRYKCGKSGLLIYDSHDCLKTFEVRKQAAAASKKAVDLALEALTTGWGD